MSASKPSHDFRRRPWPPWLAFGMPRDCQRYGMPRSQADAVQLLTLALRLAPGGSSSTLPRRLYAYWRTVRPIAKRCRHAEAWPMRLLILVRAAGQLDRLGRRMRAK